MTTRPFSLPSALLPGLLLLGLLAGAAQTSPAQASDSGQAVELQITQR